MARRWRAFVPDLPAGAAAGDEVALPREEAHHLVTVLRLSAGESVALFDGRGAEWTAELVAVERRRATARLVAPVTGTVESPLRWRLFQGACRPDRVDWVVQKATELGAVAVAVVEPAGRTDSRRRERRVARWERIAVESVKQCGRRIVPAIEALEDWPAPADGALALVCDPGPGAAPLDGLLRGPAPAELWLAVGPEEGLAPASLAALAGAGWRRVSLGPRVLRTETAGPVAAAVALHVWGDLGAPPAG